MRPCRVCPGGRAPVGGVRLSLACGGRASRCFLPVCRLWGHHVHCSMGGGGCVFTQWLAVSSGRCGRSAEEILCWGVLSGVFSCPVYCSARGQLWGHSNATAYPVFLRWPDPFPASSYQGFSRLLAASRGVISVSAELSPKLPRALGPAASSRRSLPTFWVPS